MRLILTHEQADFDALASLYGAHLLDEQALPVLPRRMNRNVRAFVTLYGAEFPFVEARDLQPGKVESVTLVDTQSLITLKGMSARTSVRVVDHHPRRGGLPDDWHISIDETGATTTILVEALQERDGNLSAIQATLLLLGIYEDTGSLTYASTTPRDVRAAGYLLEQGASLRIAGEFLNPPLSAEQRQLYDELVSRAQTHEIHGHRVVLACADAQQMTEEISTLAHKLRDLFDPDALFVLVSTPEGVRMVARSTADEIDVAAVATHFGGGGHGRAAAALIKPSPTAPAARSGRGRMAGEGRRVREDISHPLLAQVCSDLITVLPRFVQPSITVAQIMSRRPRLLKPETSVHEAARLMQRSGFEGYPVVREGKIVGLLTRRAVDRAIAHRLNLAAASLMEAGEVTVRTDDSLQTLQARMTDSGWGQIPVVDEGGHVVGIVTRTDLLKTLAPPATPWPARNLAARLERALPEARLWLVRAVAEQAAEQKVALYVVGGFVRDLLLERPSLDFDVVVEGDAIALAKSLSKKYGGRVTSHSRFGTAKWYVRESGFGPGRPRVRKQEASPASQSPIPDSLDLISARTEFYEHPTALPTVERGSIKLDLHRRDFTINTLAIRLDGRHYGELHDYWGGLSDLERGLVRVLHSLSFVDDPTRMLRAVRYEQRYGFRIESRTLQLMDEARPLLERLSGDRVRHELDLMLDEPRAVQMIARLAELDLLAVIHASLKFEARRFAALDAAPPAEFGSLPTPGGLPFRRALGWLLWLIHLPEAEIRSIARRLRFPAALTKVLAAASLLHADLPALVGLRPSAWAERLEDVPPLAVYAAHLTARGRARKSLQEYLARWRHVKPQTTGHDLKRLGLPPGPQYQSILRQLRNAWLDGEVQTVEEEMALLRRLLTR